MKAAAGALAVSLAATCPCGHAVRLHAPALAGPAAPSAIPKGKSSEEMVQEAKAKAEAAAKQKSLDKSNEHKTINLIRQLFTTAVGSAAAASTASPPADPYALLRLLFLGGATGVSVNASAIELRQYILAEDTSLWRELVASHPIPAPEDDAGVTCVRNPDHSFGAGATESLGIAVPPPDVNLADGSAAKFLSSACKAVLLGLHKPEPTGTNALLEWFTYADFLAAVAATAIQATGAPDPLLDGLAKQITSLVHTLLGYKVFLQPFGSQAGVDGQEFLRPFVAAGGDGPHKGH